MLDFISNFIIQRNVSEIEYFNISLVDTLLNTVVEINIREFPCLTPQNVRQRYQWRNSASPRSICLDSTLPVVLRQERDSQLE